MNSVRASDQLGFLGNVNLLIMSQFFHLQNVDDYLLNRDVVRINLSPRQL